VGSASGFAVFRESGTPFRTYDFSQQVVKETRKLPLPTPENPLRPVPSGIEVSNMSSYFADSSSKYESKPVPWKPVVIDHWWDKLRRFLWKLCKLYPWSLTLILLCLILFMPLFLAFSFASTVSYTGIMREGELVHIEGILSVSPKGPVSVNAPVSTTENVALLLAAPSTASQTKLQIGHREVKSESILDLGQLPFGVFEGEKTMEVHARFRSDDTAYSFHIDTVTDDSSRSSRSSGSSGSSGASSRDASPVTAGKGELRLNTAASSGRYLQLGHREDGGLSRVGINTLSPTAALHVIGDSIISGSTNISGAVQMGAASVREHLQMEQNVVMKSSLHIQGTTRLENRTQDAPFTLTGQTQLENVLLTSFSVQGNLEVQAGLQVTRQISSGGDFTLQAAPQTPVIATDTSLLTTQFRDTLNVQGDSHLVGLNGLTGDVTLSGTLRIGESLQVGGNSKLWRVDNDERSLDAFISNFLLETAAVQQAVTLRAQTALQVRWEAGIQPLQLSWNGTSLQFARAASVASPMFSLSTLGGGEAVIAKDLGVGTNLEVHANLWAQSATFTGHAPTNFLSAHLNITATTPTGNATVELSVAGGGDTFQWINSGSHSAIYAVVNANRRLTLTSSQLHVHSTLLVDNNLIIRGNWMTYAAEGTLTSPNSQAEFRLTAAPNPGQVASWTLISGPTWHQWQAIGATSTFSIDSKELMRLEQGVVATIFLQAALHIDGPTEIQGTFLRVSNTSSGAAPYFEVTVHEEEGGSVIARLQPTPSLAYQLVAQAASLQLVSAGRTSLTIAQSSPNITIHDAVTLTQNATLTSTAGNIWLRQHDATQATLLSLSADGSTSTAVPSLFWENRESTRWMQAVFSAPGEFQFIPNPNPTLSTRQYLLKLSDRHTKATPPSYALEVEGSFHSTGAGIVEGDVLWVHHPLAGAAVELLAQAPSQANSAIVQLTSGSETFQWQRKESDGMELWQESRNKVLWSIGKPGSSDMFLHEDLSVTAGSLDIGTIGAGGDVIQLNMHSGNTGVVHRWETVGSDLQFLQDGTEQLRISDPTGLTTLDVELVGESQVFVGGTLRILPSPIDINAVTSFVDLNLDATHARLQLVQNSLMFQWLVPADGSKLVLAFNSEAEEVWRLDRVTRNTTMSGDLQVSGGDLTIQAEGAAAELNLLASGSNNALLRMEEDLHAFAWVLDQSAGALQLQNTKTPHTVMNMDATSALVTLGGSLLVEGGDFLQQVSSGSASLLLKGAATSLLLKDASSEWKFKTNTPDSTWQIHQANTAYLTVHPTGNVDITGDLSLDARLSSLSDIIVSGGKASLLGSGMMQTTDSMEVNSPKVMQIGLTGATCQLQTVAGTMSLNDMSLVLKQGATTTWSLDKATATMSGSALTAEGDVRLLPAGTSTPTILMQGSTGNIEISGAMQCGEALRVGIDDAFSVASGQQATMGSVTVGETFSIQKGAETRLTVDNAGNVMLAGDVDVASDVSASNGKFLVTGVSGRLDVTGSLTVTNNLKCNKLTITSDATLKENIMPMVGSVSTQALEKLRAVRYNFIADPQRQVHDGFIAQEVQEVLPEAVHEGAQHLSIEYIQLVAHMWRASQELQADIECLQAKFAALKASRTP
jgi:hypothetical protein